MHHSFASMHIKPKTTVSYTKSPITSNMGPEHEKSPDSNIISERVIEHEVIVPKRIVREEVIEKVLVVPETIVREEIVEEVQTVRETIIELAKPVYQEKIIEVPEIEYRDKIVERVEKVVQEKIIEVPKVEVQKRVIEIPKYITRERVVEVPNIEYLEVVQEKVVEVPEVRHQYVYRDVPVPQYVHTDKVSALPETISVNVPYPVEAVTTYGYQLSQYQPRVKKISYPLYVPRFIEVPISAELFTGKKIEEMHNSQAKLNLLTSQQALGLSEIEAIATEMRQQNVLNEQVPPNAFQVALANAWKSGQLQIVTAQNTPPVSNPVVTVENS